MDEAEQAGFYQRQADAGDEPATEYGFVGRDLDIQAAERLLLAGPDSNELLVQGMAGAGKSTFLAHLAWWWQRTGLVEQVFRFSWEDRAWTAAQIIREIRARLLGPVEQARADLMPAAAQLEQTAGLLRASPAPADPGQRRVDHRGPGRDPARPRPRRADQLRTLLSRLRGGKTLVLIGSREAEDWLAPGTFADNIYPLPGLDPQAASDPDRPDPAPPPRPALARRRGRAAGAAGPDRAARRLPAADDRRAARPGHRRAVPGAGRAEGRRSRRRPRAEDHRRDRVQPRPPRPRPAGSPAAAGALHRRHPALPRRWRSTAASCWTTPVPGSAASRTWTARSPRRSGSASPPPTPAGRLGAGAAGLPLLPAHPPPRPARPARGHRRAHYQLYTNLGPELHQLLTATRRPPGAGDRAGRHPGGVRQPDRRPGLGTAGRPADRGTSSFRWRSTWTRPGSRPRGGSCSTTPSPPTPSPPGEAQHRELALLHNLAGGRGTPAAPARATPAATTRPNFQLLEAAGDRKDQGFTYHQLGTVAQEQRRFEEAEAAYRQALDIYLEFGDRHSAASTYHQLGRVAQEQRRFEEAEAAYRQALDIYLEFGDRHSAASTYHQLGMVAQEQRRFEEAEASYRQALDIFLEFGDRHSAASTYHQLGMVAAGAAAVRGGRGRLPAGPGHLPGVRGPALRRQHLPPARHGRAGAAAVRGGRGRLPAGPGHLPGVRGPALRRQHLPPARQRSRRSSGGSRRPRPPTGRPWTSSWSSVTGTPPPAPTTSSARSPRSRSGSTEAEAAYRQALDIYQEESDPRQASMTATRLGLLLAETGRHADAATVLLDAALLWHQVTGGWDVGDLRNLKRERAIIGQAAFDQLAAAKIPQDLRESLDSGIETVADVAPTKARTSQTGDGPLASPADPPQAAVTGRRGLARGV